MDPGESQSVTKAGQFYADYVGGRREVRCVVTGSLRPSWHHLDEAKPKWWHPFNIIPLSQDLNLKLDSRKYQPLPLDLRPGVLVEKAREHFEQGSFSHGYACARLGAFLSVPPRGDTAIGYGSDPDKAAEFCAYALINLRPIAAVPVAIDVIERSLMPLFNNTNLRQRIQNRTKARIAIEIGSYFRDYDVGNQAVRGCHLAEKYLNGLTTVADDVLRSRITQHSAIALAGMGDLNSAATLLDQSMDKLPEQAAYPEGTPNDILWRVRVTLQSEKPDLDMCRHLIRGVYGRKEGRIVPVWTLAELYWTDAEENLSRGQNVRALDILRRGNELFYLTGIVPTAVLAPSSTLQYRQKYPSDLYTAPRDSGGLGNFYARAVLMLDTLEAELADRGTSR